MYMNAIKISDTFTYSVNKSFELFWVYIFLLLREFEILENRTFILIFPAFSGPS